MWSGVRCHLPKQAVEYPFPCKVFTNGWQSFGSIAE
jgi:hypothetical protein